VVHAVVGPGARQEFLQRHADVQRYLLILVIAGRMAVAIGTAVFAVCIAMISSLYKQSSDEEEYA